jgi:hypothetical protein
MENRSFNASPGTQDPVSRESDHTIRRTPTAGPRPSGFVVGTQHQYCPHLFMTTTYTTRVSGVD